MPHNTTFKLGIAMAGAVSAGAYTAGVMDYLLETLDRWDRAKQENLNAVRKHGSIEEATAAGAYDPSIPMHTVRLEVIGGASAGGMTSCITTLALFEGFKFVDENNPKGEGNRLFDTWVNLNDKVNSKTLVQMCETSDLATGVIPALLNSEAIDGIADKANEIEINHSNKNHTGDWPSYIAKDLELIMTICSLRGVPLEINFGSALTEKSAETQQAQKGAPAHRMYMHKGIAHFTIDPAPLVNKDHLIPLDPENAKDKQFAIECAKATGAFPVGLKARPIPHPDLPEYITQRKYIAAHIRRTFESQEININWDKIPEKFEFTAVDGGTINNEPFGEVLRVLEERAESGKNDKLQEHALMMIDPFPNFAEESTTLQTNYILNTISEIVPNLLSAIRRQAMVKESDISKSFVRKDNMRFLIFPVRRALKWDDDRQTETLQKDDYPIACGGLGGFSGFFKREFREHDFYLGRKNCQSFLRKHFSVPYDEVTDKNTGEVVFPIFSDWEEGDKKFQRFHYLKDDQAHLPIIPDLRIYDACSKKEEENGHLDNPIQFEEIKITAEELKELRRPFRRRVSALLWAVLKKNLPFGGSGTATESEAHSDKYARRYVRKYLSNPWLVRILGYLTTFLVLVVGLAISPVLIPILVFLWYYVVTKVTNSIFEAIVEDFKMRDLMADT